MNAVALSPASFDFGARTLNAVDSFTPADTQPAGAAPFFNVVNFLLQLDPSQRDIVDEQEAATPKSSSADSVTNLARTTPVAVAAPVQIADALLRTMFESPRQAIGSSPKRAPSFAVDPLKSAADPAPAPVPFPVSAYLAAPIPQPPSVPGLPQNATEPTNLLPATAAPASATIADSVVRDQAPSRSIASDVPCAPAPLAFGAKLTGKNIDYSPPSSISAQSLPSPVTPAPAATKQGAPQREREAPREADVAQAPARLGNITTAAAPAMELASRPSSLAPLAPKLTELQPVAPPPPAEPKMAGAQPVREITLRVAPQGAPPVDVQVNQRQGQVHVLVRTPDDAMQVSLRQELPQLVSALDRAGFRTETFTPHDSPQTAAVEPAGGSEFGNLSHDSSQGSFQDLPRDASRDQTPTPKDASYSATARDPQQQQQHRQREQHAQRWLDQMEE